MSDKNTKIQRGSAALALKAGFWYVVSTFLVKGLNFIIHPIFARLFDKGSGDIGNFANFASWETILLIIASLEMQNTVARAYYDFKEDFDHYVSSVALASCSFTLILYGLSLMFSDWFEMITKIPQQYIHVMFIMLLFTGCKQIYFAKERTLYRYKGVAVLSALNALIPTLIAVAVVALLPMDQRLSGRIYGYYLPSALIGAGCLLPILLKGRKIKWKYIKYGLVLSFPLMLHYLTAQLLNSSNTIVTESITERLLADPTSAVAQAITLSDPTSLVSNASTVNHIMTALLLAVSGAITTWLMDNLNAEKVKTVRNGTLFYVIGVTVLSLGVILVGPEVIAFMGDNKYNESQVLVPGFSIATLVQASVTVFTIMLTYKKKVVATGVWTGIVAVLCVVAKYLLLDWYMPIDPAGSMEFLPYVNIASYAVLFVVNYLLVRRCGLGKYINFWAMVGVLGTALGVMAVSPFLYEHTLVRYGLIVAFAVAVGVVAIIKRDLIIKIVRKKLKKK